MKPLFLAGLISQVVTISYAGEATSVISAPPNTANPSMTMRSTFSGLSQAQMAEGLKEALLSGVEQAVTLLGRNGGFLNDPQVRIPMPPQMAEVDKVLRMLGQNQLADEFVATMNHAAEQAVAEASGVFIDAVQHVTIQDALGILSGPDDAATQYFRRTTQTNLYARFLPIVKTATDKVGVTSAYKRLLDAMGGNRYLGSLETLLFGNQPVDLDGYRTDRALDGLFKMVAQEEVQIRRNPVARTTQLLQRVFGAISRNSR